MFSHLPPVILASQSPRRHQILSQLPIPFKVVPSTFPEDLEKGDPKNYVLETAKAKGLQVLQDNPGHLIISMDTVAVLDNEILEKPLDLEDARLMLSKLSGKTHQVLTGCWIMTNDKKVSWVTETSVEFMKLSPETLDWYLSTKDWEGKAASYGYQSKGGVLVESLQGCAYNIIGFPLHDFFQHLKQF
ncbi:putative MAF-like protein [Gorgonomyces haynaldii]|nr:putative MAF-like protein [Gorgonomyces haynaldii]